MRDVIQIFIHGSTQLSARTYVVVLIHLKMVEQRRKTDEKRTKSSVW